MPRHPRPAPIAATLLAIVVAAPPVLAQTAPGAAMPGAAMPDAEPTSDPVTDAQVRQLRENGLIARQTEIGEGLLLMDRQLRQAQLAQQVMALLGADQPVEVAPGEFRDFSGTPLGIRERIAQLQLELQLIDLTEQVEEARAANGGTLSPLAALLSFRPAFEADGPRSAEAPAPVAAPPEEPEPAAATEPTRATAEPEISVRELRGGGGRYSALLRVDRAEVEAVPGDDLPGGIRVVAVQPEQVVLRLPGAGLRSYPTPK